MLLARLQAIVIVLVAGFAASVAGATSFISSDTTLNGVSQGGGYGTFSSASSGTNATLTAHGYIQPDYISIGIGGGASATPAFAGAAGSMSFSVANAATYQYDNFPGG